MKWTNLLEETQLNEAKFAKTEEEIRAWIRESGAHVSNLSIEHDMVSCTDFILTGNHDITSLGVKFGDVTGDFVLVDNALKTLKGCPEVVGGKFRIGGKDIKSLKLGPRTVHGEFSVVGSQLTDLTGAPQVVGSMTIARNTVLKSLKGGPTHVLGDANIYFNKLVSSYEGYPEVIDGRLTLYFSYDDKSPISSTLNKIQKYVKKCNKISIGDVTHEIMGLTQIEGLTEIKNVAGGKNLVAALAIIKKYLGIGKDMAKLRACQEELMDANLDDFASM